MMALSAGCTTTYTPTPGEPVARLRLVASHNPKYGTDKGHSTHLRVRDLSACPAQPVVASANNVFVTPVNLHMPAPPDAPDKFYTELLIPANKLLGLAVTGAGPGGHLTCEIRTRFRPSAGMDYEAESRWSSNEKKCFLDLYTLAADNRGVGQRKPFTPLDPETSAQSWFSFTAVVPIHGGSYLIQTAPPPLPDLCKLPAPYAPGSKPG